MKYDTPFPHLVLDWSDHPIGGIRDEFPTEDPTMWQVYSNELEQKRACEKPMGPHTLEYIRTIQHPFFIDTISEQLCIDGHVTMSLEGGGYHWLPAGGGKLGVHVDFNIGRDGLFRRANCLLYLNPEWKPGDGGELQLGRHGDPDMKIIEPTWGKMVVFPTGENTWHGNPNPCLKDRFSYAAYFFSTEPPADYPGDAHSTVFS